MGERPGVRMPSEHWSSPAVHSYRYHASDRVIRTWCGLTADLEDGASQTDDLISCQDASAHWGQEIRSSVWEALMTAPSPVDRLDPRAALAPTERAHLRLLADDLSSLERRLAGLLETMRALAEEAERAREGKWA